jgi:preprotein translocase subunit SecA
MVYKTKVHTKKWKKCVKEVKAKETNVNPYAVCTSSIGKKESFKKKGGKK